MYYPFWEVASHWDKITTFSFLSIIQLNYHQLINLGYEKIQGIPPSGTYLTLGMTQVHSHFYLAFYQMIIKVLISVIENSRNSLFWAIYFPRD